jgi:hypothetical protein
MLHGISSTWLLIGFIFIALLVGCIFLFRHLFREKKNAEEEITLTEAERSFADLAKAKNVEEMGKTLDKVSAKFEKTINRVSATQTKQREYFRKEREALSKQKKKFRETDPGKFARWGWFVLPTAIILIALVLKKFGLAN